MTLFDYLRKECKNCLINKSKFDFNELYNKYIKYKNIGNELSNENIIIYFESNIKSIYQFKNLTDDVILNYKNVFNNSDIKKNLELCEFIHLLTCLSSLKIDASHGKIDNIKNKIYRHLDNKLIEMYEDDYHQLFENLISEFENNNLDYKDISEIFEYDDNGATLYIDYPSEGAMIYHMLLLNLIYYSFLLAENPKLQKICPICKEKYYTKGKHCPNCAKEYANHRRKYNAKCKRRRAELGKLIYLCELGDNSSSAYYKAVDFVTGNTKSYNDLKKLEHFISLLKKELNN